jgi:hypothetical protein
MPKILEIIEISITDNGRGLPIKACVSDVFKDKTFGDIEVVYHQNSMKYVKKNAKQVGDAWEFADESGVVVQDSHRCVRELKNKVN